MKSIIPMIINSQRCMALGISFLFSFYQLYGMEQSISEDNRPHVEERVIEELVDVLNLSADQTDVARLDNALYERAIGYLHKQDFSLFQVRDLFRRCLENDRLNHKKSVKRVGARIRDKIFAIKIDALDRLNADLKRYQPNMDALYIREILRARGENLDGISSLDILNAYEALREGIIAQRNALQKEIEIERTSEFEEGLQRRQAAWDRKTTLQKAGFYAGIVGAVPLSLLGVAATAFLMNMLVRLSVTLLSDFR